MTINARFNALACGLGISSRYDGLFFDTAEQGETKRTTYYNQHGMRHNLSGPAVVLTKSGEVTHQEYWVDGKDVSDQINNLITAGALQTKADDGVYEFDETDQFTIAMAMNA